MPAVTTGATTSVASAPVGGDQGAGPDDDAVWQAVGAHVFDTMVVLDRDGQVVWRWRDADRPARDGAPSPTGHRMLSRIHPEDLPRLIEELRLVREEDRRGRVRIRTAAPDGDGTWLDAEVTAVVAERDEDGPRSVLICSTVTGTTDADPRDRDGGGYSFAAAAPIGLALWTGFDRLVWCNEPFSTLSGLVPGTHDAPPGDDDGPVREALAALASHARADGSAVAVVPFDDCHVRLRAQPLASGDRADVVVSAEDVTQEVLARAETATIARTFEATFEHVPVGLALLDLDGGFRRVNPAWTAITGLTEEDVRDAVVCDVVDGRDGTTCADLLARVVADGGPAHQVEVRVGRADRERRWVELRLSLVRHGDVAEHLVCTVADVTHRRTQVETLRAANDALSHQATHDHLTGLPNRALLFEHLARATGTPDHGAGSTELLLCDLDQLKPVNDTHGHLAGDAVLFSVGQRLARLSRDGDVVARLGGDEFVVLAHRLPSVADADDLAQRFIDAVREPIHFDGTELRVTLSVGITSVVPGDTPPAVLARADAAAYEAKAVRDCFRRAPAPGPS